MKTFNRLVLMALAACLPLGGCATLRAWNSIPDPISRPVTMPDGKVYYPPPGGWPGDRGGESGGSGGKN
jgi:hypothetical protein